MKAAGDSSDAGQNYPGGIPTPLLCAWRLLTGQLDAQELVGVRGVCRNGPEYACGPCHWSL
eukprot:7865220-Pyramimonas_sp.AAC.1